MKIILIIISVLLFSCKSQTEKAEKVEQIRTEIDLPSEEKLDRLRSMSLGTIVDDRLWIDSAGIWFATLSIENNIEQERGGVHIVKYKFGKDTEIFWANQDKINCEEADLVVSSDLDSMIIEDIDKDGINEIIIVYTLSCTYDVSPQTKYMVIEHNQTSYVLKGQTLDPGNEYNIDKLKLNADSIWPEQHKVKAGNIVENVSITDSLPMNVNVRLFEIWKKSLQ